MGWVRVTDDEGKGANNSTELAVYLAKFKALEDRVIRTEVEIEKIEGQISASKKFVLALAGAALTGIASLVTPMVIAYLKTSN